MSKTRVTIWNEFLHEKQPEIAKVYPHGIHGAIAKMLGVYGELEIRTATLEEREHGLTDTVLDSTDVLIWWGHIAHSRVSDDVADKVWKKVMEGMRQFDSP